MKYETLGYTHTGIFIVSDKVKYNPPKTDTELESNYLLNLSSMHSEKYLINQYMVSGIDTVSHSLTRDKE